MFFLHPYVVGIVINRPIMRFLQFAVAVLGKNTPHHLGGNNG